MTMNFVNDSDWYTLNCSCQDVQGPNIANHPRWPGKLPLQRDPRKLRIKQWRQHSTFESLSNSCRQPCSRPQAERRPLGPENICLQQLKMFAYSSWKYLGSSWKYLCRNFGTYLVMKNGDASTIRIINQVKYTTSAIFAAQALRQIPFWRILGGSPSAYHW